nr:tandem-95 repeat protein [Granulosicoccus sp.]
TDTQAIAVTVTNVNEDPVITSASAVNAAENQTTVTTVTSTDVDGDTPNYSIVGGVDAGLFSIDGSSGALTFITAPDFETPADAGANNVYDVTVQVADGNGGTDTQGIAVTVTNVNEDPMITSASAVNVSENQTSVLTVTSTDVDGGTPTYSIAGGADAGLFSIDGSSGALTFSTAPDFEIPADSGADNVYDVTVQVADGNGGTDTQAIAVTVTNVNEDPLITSAATVNAAENQMSVLTVTSTDVDGGTPTYAITGGADAGHFSINGSTGALTFNTAPDFESPADTGANNVYDLTVQVADGNGGTDTQTIAVTVTNVNEDPVISSAASVNAAENQTAVTTITSTDVDGDSPTYSISGGTDAGLFSINGSSGALTFNTAPDFESPADTGADNVYDVTVQVADGNGGTDTQAIAVTVTNVNENPVITSAATVSAAENQTTVTTVTSTDVDGGAPIYTITGGADAALFSVNGSSGALTFNFAPDFEVPDDAGANNVYEVNVQVADGSGGMNTQAIVVTVTNANDAPEIAGGGDVDGGTEPLTIIVDENQTSVMRIVAIDADTDATQTYHLSGGADYSVFTIDSSTGVLKFVSAPNYELKDNYEVEVTVTDNGGLTAVQTLSINIRDVNESPTAQTDTLEASENQLLIIDPVSSLLSNDSDPEQDTLTLVNFTQPQNGTLTLNAQGLLVYEPDDHFVGTDSFDYDVEDTGGHQVSARVWLDVKALNDPILTAALPTENEVGNTTEPNPEQPDQTEPGAATGIESENTQETNLEATAEPGEPVNENMEASQNTTAIEALFTTLESTAAIEPTVDAPKQRAPTHSTVSNVIDSLLQQLLEHEITDLDSIFDLDTYEQYTSIELRDAIFILRDQIDQIMDQSSSSSPLVTLAPSVVGASLTAGIVTWALRSGLLISATIAATPLWRPLDPVPILAHSDEND